MKKLLIGVLTALTIVAFKPKINVYHSLSFPVLDSNDVTLNGFTFRKADSMVKYCIGTIDRSPENTQVWFSKAIVDSIYKVLKADSSANMSTDGVRLYFARDKSMPIHANNIIMVVPTYYSGIERDSDGNFYKVHTDYFKDPKRLDYLSLGI